MYRVKLGQYARYVHKIDDSERKSTMSEDDKYNGFDVFEAFLIGLIVGLAVLFLYSCY